MGKYIIIPTKLSKKDRNRTSSNLRIMQEKRLYKLETKYLKELNFCNKLCKMSEEGFNLYIDMFYKNKG